MLSEKKREEIKKKGMHPNILIYTCWKDNSYWENFIPGWVLVPLLLLLGI